MTHKSRNEFIADTSVRLLGTTDSIGKRVGVAEAVRMAIALAETLEELEVWPWAKEEEDERFVCKGCGHPKCFGCVNEDGQTEE